MPNSEIDPRDHGALAADLEELATEAPGHLAGRVPRPDAHRADRNRPTQGSDAGIRCLLEARCAGMEPLLATAFAATPSTRQQPSSGSNTPLCTPSASTRPSDTAGRTPGSPFPD